MVPPRRSSSSPRFDAKGLEIAARTVSKDGTRVPYSEVAPQRLDQGWQESDMYSMATAVLKTRCSPRTVPTLAWPGPAGRRVHPRQYPRWRRVLVPGGTRPRLKANRHRAYDDFIAVAEDLIRRKVTSREHLGVQGESNGGLLVGNMLTRRPDLFRAVVCGSPLLDMRRYNHLLAGASWMGEYGDPDKPEEWSYIRGFSPYHNLKENVKYPRTLILNLNPRRPRPPRPAAAGRWPPGSERAWSFSVLCYENIEESHSLQFDRAATILTFVERLQAVTQATPGRSVDWKEVAASLLWSRYRAEVSSSICPPPALNSIVGIRVRRSGSGRNETSRDHRGRDHIMKRFRGVLCWIVLLTVIVPVGYRATGRLLRHDWRPKTDALASRTSGGDLFLHEWTPGDPITTALSDGLGPVFQRVVLRRLPSAKGNQEGAGRRNITSPSSPRKRQTRQQRSRTA